MSLYKFCKYRWEEIRATVLGGPLADIPVALAVNSIGFSWPGRRSKDLLGEYMAIPSLLEMIRFLKLGRKNVDIILQVLLLISDSHSNGTPAPFVGLQWPDPPTLEKDTATLANDPVAFLDRNWQEMKQVMLTSPYAEQHLDELARAWGIMFSSPRAVKLLDILACVNLTDYINRTVGYGSVKRREIQNIIYRAWSETDPGGLAGPPPPGADEQARSQLSTLGQSLNPAEVAELAMANAQLSMLECRVLLRRYGLTGKAPMTLKAIGIEEGQTRESIRRVQARAEKKLNAHLVNQAMLKLLPDPDSISPPARPAAKRASQRA